MAQPPVEQVFGPVLVPGKQVPIESWEPQYERAPPRRASALALVPFFFFNPAPVVDQALDWSPQVSQPVIARQVTSESFFGVFTPAAPTDWRPSVADPLFPRQGESPSTFFEFTPTPAVDVVPPSALDPLVPRPTESPSVFFEFTPAPAAADIGWLPSALDPVFPVPTPAPSVFFLFTPAAAPFDPAEFPFSGGYPDLLHRDALVPGGPQGALQAPKFVPFPVVVSVDHFPPSFRAELAGAAVIDPFPIAPPADPGTPPLVVYPDHVLRQPDPEHQAFFTDQSLPPFPASELPLFIYADYYPERWPVLSPSFFTPLFGDDLWRRSLQFKIGRRDKHRIVRGQL